MPAGWTWRCSPWIRAGCIPRPSACWTRWPRATGAPSRFTGPTPPRCRRMWTRTACTPSMKAWRCARPAAKSARSSLCAARWPGAAPGSPGSAARNRPPAANCPTRSATPCSASTSSTRWRRGTRPMCGASFARWASRTTRCTTRATRPSAANPVRAPSARARTCGPAVGGGNRRTRRNAACMPATGSSRSRPGCLRPGLLQTSITQTERKRQ